MVEHRTEASNGLVRFQFEAIIYNRPNISFIKSSSYEIKRIYKRIYSPIKLI